MKVLFLDTVHPILSERLTAGRNGSVWMAHHTPRRRLLVPWMTLQASCCAARFASTLNCLTACPTCVSSAALEPGLENIDLASAFAAGIQVFNSPEGNRDAVGEHALGMLLSLMNLLREADASVKEGNGTAKATGAWNLHRAPWAFWDTATWASAFAGKLTGNGLPHPGLRPLPR